VYCFFEAGCLPLLKSFNKASLCVYCFYPSTEGLGCVQDTILVVPPYPYSIAEDTADVPWEDMWYARAQLFFTCHQRPSGGRQT
jgi:hypothetical protein